MCKTAHRNVNKASKFDWFIFKPPKGKSETQYHQHYKGVLSQENLGKRDPIKPLGISKERGLRDANTLTAIFNISLNTGIYIDGWKLDRVSPIYKSEDRRKCENYQPISIL